MNAAPTASVRAAPDHFVQFYDEDAALAAPVARYIAGGLATGCAGIMIADRAHTAQILELWQSEGFDHESACERGQLLILDAQETLDRFMRGGKPDAALFDRTVGETVRNALARYGDAVAFGEMVALLAAEGRTEAAVKLEDLWNRLGATHRFSLFCAYGMRHFRDADSRDAFRAVCDAHAHIVPAESLHIPRSEPAQLRLIAELHQKAQALEHELQRRRQAEEQLRARERDLADFLENGVLGLHRVGADGTILWANRAELELLGYSAGEYIGHSITEFHADDSLICRILETLSKGGQLKDQPAKLVCKDGSLKHVLINSNSQIENGRFVATRCFTRDVTDRWLAQEALRERGAVLHLALQGARMGYWIGDLERSTIRCSPEMASLFGLSGTLDLAIESFLDLMHSEDRELFRSALRESIRARATFAAEFRVRGDVADWRWFEARGEAVYDDNGAAVRFYGICADITARKRQEHMLRHFASVVDSAKDVIISTLPEGTVTSWNASARELFGMDSSEILGKPIEVLIPAELHDEERAARERIARGESLDRYVTTRISKDGKERRMSLGLSPIRDARGHVVGVSRISHEVVS